MTKPYLWPYFTSSHLLRALKNYQYLRVSSFQKLCCVRFEWRRCLKDKLETGSSWYSIPVSKTENYLSSFAIHHCYRSSHQRCSWKKGVLKIFTKFTGKDLCRVALLISFIEKETLKQVFSSEFRKSTFSKNTFFTKHLRVTASTVTIFPCFSKRYTAWKVSIFGVILFCIFSHSDQNNSKYGHFYVVTVNEKRPLLFFLHQFLNFLNCHGFNVSWGKANHSA